MSLVEIQGYGDSGDDCVSDSVSDSVGWTGGVPNDARKWCAALHTLICALYGDSQETGVEPLWWTENDDEFIAYEEERRELPAGTLMPLLRRPYYHNVTVSEVTLGRKATVAGHLFGIGEKLGSWDAFQVYFQKPGADGRLRSLQWGQIACVGEYPFEVQVTVVRILRGQKPTGTAASGKVQNCYYAPIQHDGSFGYVSLQHLWYDCSKTSVWCGPDLDDHWLDDTSFEGHQPKRDQLAAADFAAKSVAAVTKAAAGFISKYGKLPGAEQKAKKAKKVVTATRRRKAPVSDDESDGESGGEMLDSDS